MNKSIKHLEDIKQKELNAILEIILGVGKSHIKPEMIIVFGDYIKTDPYYINIVREGDMVVNYFQIINILIITRKPTQEKNMRLSRELNSLIKSSKLINSNVNILLEDIYSFNEGIIEGRYYYLDILTTGILLYDSKKCKIRNREKLSQYEIDNIKKEDFEAWYEIANEFFLDYKNAFNRGSYKIAIFYLHQAVESFFTTYFLVKDGYKPKTHDLEILYSKAKSYSKKFNKFFDLENENYYFELLKSAYINARYKKNYKVNKEDLEFIENKVLYLKNLIKNLSLKELPGIL